MNHPSDNPFASLNRIFHEPNRLAIVSTLCGSDLALTFNELKTACNLTDGNLNRHLKTLEEAKVIKIKKSSNGTRPKTHVRITDIGRERFIAYLTTLEDVLHRAAESVAEEPAPALGNLFGPTMNLHRKA